MEGPLTELRNQRLPRRKMAQTYGKKRATAAITAHRELFGCDENDIEVGLQKLNLETSKSPTPAKSSPPSKSVKTTTLKTSKTSTKKNAPATEKSTITIHPPIPEKSSLVSPSDLKTLTPLLSLADTAVESFSTFGSKITRLFHVEKIGEGSFAEVFKLTSRNPNTASASSADGAIIKVIPLSTPSSDQSVSDRLSAVDAVAREVRILRTLDSMHGFTRFGGVRLVRGLWPVEFLDAFYAFKRKHRSRAINPAPDDDFDERQIYALIEMDDAGMEIALLKRPSVFQVYDVFWTTVILLANAEEKVEFEHRDLHLSNVCVRPRVSMEGTARAGEGIVSSEMDVRQGVLATMMPATKPSLRLGLSNLRVTIIDYTITRCILAPLEPSSSPEPEIAYDDMSFTSHLPVTLSSSHPHDHDKESTLQMATYRKAKTLVTRHARTHGIPLHSKWRSHVPRTNVVWLAYLLAVLTKRAKANCKGLYVVRGSSRSARRLQLDMWEGLAAVLDVLEGFGDEALGDVLGVFEAGAEGCGGNITGCGEVGGNKATGQAGGENTDVDGNGDYYSGSEDEDEDRHTKALETLPASAKDLLVRAMDEGWVRKEEVEAMMARLQSDD